MNALISFHTIRVKARQQFATLTVLTTLAGGLALPPNASAAPLPVLNTLPLTVSGQSYVSAAGGNQYAIYAFTHGDEKEAITDTRTVQLGRREAPGAEAGEGHFYLNAVDIKNKAVMSIDFFVTNRRCMLTSIAPDFAQSSQLGRLIEITPLLQYVVVHDEEFFYSESPLGDSKVDSPSSVCTNDAGQLSVDFSAPAFGMVQMTVISHAAGGTSRVAATPIMLELGAP